MDADRRRAVEEAEARIAQAIATGYGKALPRSFYVWSSDDDA